MFKVGDVIVALPSANNRYNWTTQNNRWKGVVTKVTRDSYADIEVRTLECNRSEGFVVKWWVNSKYFELDRPSIEDFIKSLAERKTVERKEND